MDPPAPITKVKVIAVEGDDDRCFFDKFIDRLNIPDAQTLKMNGKNPLGDKVRTIRKISGWKDVVSFGLVVDADSNYASTLQSVRHALKVARLAVPNSALLTVGRKPKVTFLILPGLNMNGAIEDLCLSSIRPDPAMACVDAYFLCLQQCNVNCPKISKAKVHAFLASRPEPDKKLGQAAQASYWPLDSQVFDDVRTLLQML